MGERYYITGVQLGMLQALEDESKRKKLVDEITGEQFICNCFTDKDEEDFKESMKNRGVK